jgi:protein involved in polysaccharide export with SLBB domain
MVNRFIVFLFLLSSTSILGAQQQSQSGVQPGADNSNTWDCSDPLLATSSQCAGQNLDESNPYPLAGSQIRTSPLTSVSGVQQTAPGQTYSDLESQSRQASTRNRTLARLASLPEPLTEFQKFVASTTGQILPIFGASLFQNVPSTFAPLDNAPVPPDYVIGPGDELRIRVWGQVNFQANVRVDRSGEVYMPVSQIGPVHVAGLQYSELQSHLREAVGRVYRNFELLADVGQIRAIQVYVAGQARRPGVYTVSSLSTLIDALFSSGGPSVQGSLRKIQLRRGDETVTELDLYDFLTRGDKSKDVKLLSGDIIFIPAVGPQAAVNGSARNPGIYELKANESLNDLIADAGGASTIASDARVSIERIVDHNERHAMEVAYDAQGLATTLADGDLVRILAMVPQYKQTVTLRGNIANPGRFAWKPGMRISDLIPDKESLLTRNYWWKRTQLGLPAPEFEPTAGFSEMRQPIDNHPITMRPSEAPERYGQPSQFGTGAGLTQDPNGYGLQQNQYNNQQTSQPGSVPNQVGQPPSQYGAPIDQYGNPQTQQNQFGVQQPGQTLNAQQRAGASSLGAEQGELPSRFPRSTPRTEIRLDVPEIDWDYAVIQRLDSTNLKTILVPFDLGKLVLQHDASQNLELQPGDVVSILSEADIRMPIAQQTKLVRLEGEFAHAGSYTVQPGETLRQLVERAGGLTANAYLYGSEFTRESTRRAQQSRLDEYIQDLDLRIQRSNLALAASGGTGGQQDIPGGTYAQNSERELVTRLRQLRATGRIVLQFTPDTGGTSGLPDITLEDGDRFVIPPVPASINIVGAVNDQNSFLYARDSRVGRYLQMAGGLTRDADKKREFVIRANGEVVGYDAAKGVWGNEFNNLPLFAGDTVVIPEKTFKPPLVRGFLEWSQVFSQLALGSAAIAVLQ